MIRHLFSAGAALLFFSRTASAQLPLVIYNDSLANGFQDWSWTDIHNFSSTGTVHSGSNAIGVYAENWQGISFYHDAYDTSAYTNLVFWAHGGPLGGQRLQIYCDFASGSSSSTYSLPTALTANTWTQFTISLSAIGAANATNLTRINLQLTPSGATNFFYLDDVQLAPKAVPSVINIGVNTTVPLRTVDSRMFGVNAAVWDNNYDSPNSVSLLNEMGTRIVRLPGGSLSDEYHWMSNTTLSNTWQWATSFANFVHVITNSAVNAQTIITVNYGTGTTNEAASWVRHANVTNHFGFKYWEIGNENYGTWETDTNVFPHDGYTYAVRAAKFFAVMKGADPTIKIGVPVVTGENSYVNGYTSHPIYNTRTGQTNYGWTPVVLSTLKSLGVTPDFLAYHVYPEYGADSDAAILQAAANWPLDAADLRQQMTDYFGAGGTNIELLCTENNADAGSQGRQSTSIVNGLYYADSLGTLLKTEFNGFVWWDFRNGTDTGGDFNSLLYGWRNYGDLGMVNGANTRHPVFYAAKLMSYFARPGDTVLNATSSYSLLSPYAIRHANGSVSILGLNKTYVTNLVGKISLTGFTPQTNATIYSYGIAQDEATRTNAIYALQDLATNAIFGITTNFNYSFPPYSLTVLNLFPSAPGVTVVPSTGQFVLQVQGQPNVRYVVQSCTNLLSGNWTSVATNTLTTSTWNVTNSFSGPWKFWRAAWLP